MTDIQLEDLARLHLEPGDVLVVRSRDRLPLQAVEHMRHQIAEAGLPCKVLVLDSGLSLDIVNHAALATPAGATGDPSCPADAENERNDGPRPSNAGSTPISPSSSAASLAPAMEQLLQSHRELVNLLTTLVTQNADMLAAISTVLDDFEGGEPTTYLDGTPIKN